MRSAACYSFSLDGNAASRNPNRVNMAMAEGEWMQQYYELMGRPTFLEDSNDLPPKLLRLGGWLRLHGHSWRKP